MTTTKKQKCARCGKTKENHWWNGKYCFPFTSGDLWVFTEVTCLNNKPISLPTQNRHGAWVEKRTKKRKPVVKDSLITQKKIWITVEQAKVAAKINTGLSYDQWLKVRTELIQSCRRQLDQIEGGK